MFFIVFKKMMFDENLESQQPQPIMRSNHQVTISTTN